MTAVYRRALSGGLSRWRATLACSLAALLLIATVPAAAATQERWAGQDRYSTAVEVSRRAFPEGAGVVWVASGQQYPDALAAGPAAASLDGPLLLVPRDGVLPAVVKDELRRLNPFAIQVAGGPGAVSDVMASQLRDFGDVHRVAGANRYETAADLAFWASDQYGTVFLATGRGFADALAGAAAAGRLSGGLMLTEPDTLPTSTREELDFLQPTHVVLLGGTGVISETVRSQVRSLLPSASVERWSGADRYATAAAVSRGTYPQGASTVFLAAGDSYPDALAGGPAAARRGAPVLLTRRDCVPAATLSEIARLGATNVVALGGSGVVSDRAALLTPC